MAAGILGAVATDLAGFWHLPGAGFSAAFAVVVVAYLSAPSHKLHAATAFLLVGAAIAWLLLEPSFYPKSYGDHGAYVRTHLPVIATYVGGLFGLLAAALVQRRVGPDNSFKPNRLRRSA